jgi:hypothetical protein
LEREARPVSNLNKVVTALPTLRLGRLKFLFQLIALIILLLSPKRDMHG